MDEKKDAKAKENKEAVGTAGAAPEAPKAEEQPKKTFPKEDLMPIIDSLMTNGYATMPFKIRDINVILKTRFTWEDQLIYKKMNDYKGDSAVGFRREFTLWSMAASIAQFGKYVFNPLNDPALGEKLDESLVERYDFLRSLNTMFVDIIEKKQFEFDEMQAYIVTNFDEILKDF